MNQVFKALSDPTRREILRILSHGERTAGELAEPFDMTKPSMSHHFAVLKEADLIRSRREGQQIHLRAQHDGGRGRAGTNLGPVRNQPGR